MRYRNIMILRIRLLISLTLLCSLATTSSSLASASVAYTKGKITGVWACVVTVDLNNPNIRLTPAVAQRGIGASETFRSMLQRTRPAAAINGTFFCTRTFRPTGDIVIDGNLIAKGCLGTPIVMGPSGVSFVPPGSASSYNFYDYDHVLVAGPSLLLRGVKIVNPRSQGFKSSVHFTRRIRSAIGLTVNNKLVMAITRDPVYLSELAWVMIKLKCTDAAVLDGGSSTGLYWKGKLVANPSRAMTNCLLVYDNPSVYEMRKNCFYPITRYASRPANTVGNTIRIEL